MWWFADVESQIVNGTTTPRSLVDCADANWSRLDAAPRVFLTERSNDGAWLRSWLQALEDLPYFV